MFKDSIVERAYVMRREYTENRPCKTQPSALPTSFCSSDRYTLHPQAKGLDLRQARTLTQLVCSPVKLPHLPARSASFWARIVQGLGLGVQGLNVKTNRSA